MANTTQETQQRTAAPREVAQALFDGVIKGDLTPMDTYTHPDCVDDFVAIGRFHGRDAIKGFFEELFTAFPDFRIEVERITADDDSAVVQWEATGTFTGGPFLGIDPNGRVVSIRGVDVMEISDGQVRYNTIYYDGATFARAIGMLPREGSPAESAVRFAFNTVTRIRTKLRGGTG